MMRSISTSRSNAHQKVARSLALIAVVLGLLGSAHDAAAKGDPTRLLKKANDALMRADYAAARGLYDRVLKKTHGTSIDARIGLGQVHLELAEYKKARESAAQLMQEVALDDPRRSAVHLLQGEALLRSYLDDPGDTADSAPRLRKAEAELKQALELGDRKSTAAWAGLVQIYCQLDRTDDASDAARGLLSSYPVAALDPAYKGLAENKPSSCGRLGRRPKPGAVDLRCGRLVDGDPGQCVPYPEAISKPSAQYTEQARRARVAGIVIVDALVDETGRVREVEIVRDLENGLGQAAAEAVRRWRFEPPTLDGRAVSAIFELSVNFQLR